MECKDAPHPGDGGNGYWEKSFPPPYPRSGLPEIYRRWSALKGHHNYKDILESY